MRVLVCGGRDYSDLSTAFRVLDALHAERLFSRVIHGACGLDAGDAYEASRLSGTDGLAEAWATTRSVPVERYPAAWKRYGRSAGPRRNTIMVLKMPDLCVAFPGGRGTTDMVRKARVAGVRVIQVLWDGTMQEGG